MPKRVFILDAAKTGSGRSRFFAGLADILVSLGHSVEFIYPGRTSPERRYDIPEGCGEWPVAHVRESDPALIRWGVDSGARIGRHGLERIPLEATDLLIVPATLNFEVLSYLTRGPYKPRVMVSDHTAARLIDGRLTERQIRNYHQLIARADLVHVVTPPLGSIARSAGAKKVVTIRNMVTPHAYIRWPDLVSPPEPRLRAIAAPGRLEEGKGHHHLLAAFGMLLDRGCSYELHIYGDGPEQDSLAALAEKQGVQDRVRFMGFRTDLVTALRNYPIVALASNEEADPLSLKEAMASGCIAVFPRTAAGPAFIISHGRDGLLTMSNAPSDMASGLARAMQLCDGRPARRLMMQMAARRKARAWTIDATRNRWRALLSEMGPGRTMAIY